MKIRKLTLSEILKSLFISVVLFIVLGIVKALWENPFFIRVTPNTYIDFIILTLESVIIGFYMGTKANKACDYSKKATVGGVFGFLGFGCLVCNKILLFTFGASFLLSYIEPIRYYMGFAGIFIMGYFLYEKLKK